MSMLDNRNESYMDYDVENMVTELTECDDEDCAGHDYLDMSYDEFDALMERHEVELEPDEIVSDEELIAAIRCTQAAWAVMIKVGDDVEMVHLHNPAFKTEGQVRAHVKKFVNPMADLQIFPIV